MSKVFTPVASLIPSKETYFSKYNIHTQSLRPRPGTPIAVVPWIGVIKMKYLSKLILSVLILSHSILSFAEEAHVVLNEDDVRVMLNEKNLGSEATETIIQQLKSKFEGAPIELSGALYASGVNGSFFVDNDEWDFDIFYKDPNTNQLSFTSAVVNATFYNGGISLGVSYKWLFIFLPKEISLQTLPGTVFSRGISISPLGLLELGVMPAKNRPGTAFVLAPNLGIGGPFITFPKLEINRVDVDLKY